MTLRSNGMTLNGSERSWLPWFGNASKLRMGWACWINSNRYKQLEEIFESLSATRVKLLQQWCDNQWTTLDAIGQALTIASTDICREELIRLKSKIPDATELFVLDTSGKAIISSVSASLPENLNSAALKLGLQQRFLHGPYIDPRTRTLGPSTSKFHDAVTRSEERRVGKECRTRWTDVIYK